jgi:hypothetical protein
MNKHFIVLVAALALTAGSLSAAHAERRFVAIPLSHNNRQLPADVEAEGGFRRLAAYEAMHAFAVPDQAAERVLARLVNAGFEICELEDVIHSPVRKIASGNAFNVMNGNGLYVVQYIAPPTAEWQTAVRQTGVRVIDALPERAMIVAATAGQIRALAAQPFVQYAAPYSADMKSGPVAQPGHQLFTVQVADTPASADYIALLRTRVGGFITESRNGSELMARIQTDLATARALLDDRYVVAVEAFYPPHPSDERQALGVTGVATLTSTMTKYLSWLSARGIVPSNLTNDTWGRKIVIDVADTGVDLGCCSHYSTAHEDLAGRVVYHGGTAPRYDCNFADNVGHGTVVATIAAGLPTAGQNIAGTATAGTGIRDSDGAGQYYYGMGIAPGARLGNTRIIEGLAQGTVSDWTRIAVTSRCNTPTAACTFTAENCPATVQNHSHNEYGNAGANAGRYTTNAREMDMRVRDANPNDGAAVTPLAVSVAAGNYHQDADDYTKMVMAFATAKNVISMGGVETHRTSVTTGCNWSSSEDINRNSTESFNVLAYMSRRGTLDNRIKPDLVAPATVSFGAQTRLSGPGYCTVAGDPNSATYPYPQYQGASGTSWAAPVAAGSVALLRYYYDKNHAFTPSPAMYKAMLVAGARSITGQKDRLETALQNMLVTVPKWPNAAEGFGVINLTDLITPGVFRDWRDQQYVLTNGQALDFTVSVVDTSKPVRVALAWTDPPAAVDASVTLVNDLDLRATGYSFRVYGNLTATDGYSTVNPGCGRPVCAYFGDVRNNVEVLNINPSLFADPANRTFTVRVNAPNLQGIGVPGQSVNSQDFALFVINGDIQ